MQNRHIEFEVLYASRGAVQLRDSVIVVARQIKESKMLKDCNETLLGQCFDCVYWRKHRGSDVVDEVECQGSQTGRIKKVAAEVRVSRIEI